MTTHYSPVYAACFHQSCNHQICTTTLSLSQNIDGTKHIVSPLSKSWGTYAPLSHWNSVPALAQTISMLVTVDCECSTWRLERNADSAIGVTWLVINCIWHIVFVLLRIRKPRGAGYIHPRVVVALSHWLIWYNQILLAWELRSLWTTFQTLTTIETLQVSLFVFKMFSGWSKNQEDAFSWEPNSKIFYIWKQPE